MRMVQNLLPVKAAESSQLVVQDEQDAQLGPRANIFVAQCVHEAN